MDLQNYTLWEISSVIFPKSKASCQLQCIPGTKIMRILKFIWEMQLVEWSGLGVSLVLLLGEKLLSINDDLAIQSRWYHYLKMCQITLITMKGSVSYITWVRGHLPPEKADACDFLLVTKRLRHAEVARHSDHVTRPFLSLSFFSIENDEDHCWAGHCSGLLHLIQRKQSIWSWKQTRCSSLMDSSAPLLRFAHFKPHLLLLSLLSFPFLCYPF